MADTEGHSQKFADAFSSILADETGPEKKKRRKVKADAGPILSRVDTSAADRQEVAEKKKLRAARKAKAVRRMVRGKDRRRPETNLDERERALQKIATKGVVKLFNAVAEAQKGLLSEESGVPLRETKRTKEMSKDNFLKMLKGEAAPADETAAAADETEPKAGWDVLQEDYGMKHTSLKHWNDEDDEDEDEDEDGMNQEEESDSDDEEEDEEESEEEEEEESEEEDEVE